MSQCWEEGSWAWPQQLGSKRLVKSWAFPKQQEKGFSWRSYDGTCLFIQGSFTTAGFILCHTFDHMSFPCWRADGFPSTKLQERITVPQPGIQVAL